MLGLENVGLSCLVLPESPAVTAFPHIVNCLGNFGDSGNFILRFLNLVTSIFPVQLFREYGETTISLTVRNEDLINHLALHAESIDDVVGRHTYPCVLTPPARAAL